MSLEIQKNQLASELPLSFSKQRETQKHQTGQIDPTSQSDKRTKKAHYLPTEKINSIVNDINSKIHDNSLLFEVRRDLNETVIKIIDTQNNRVILQIPSKEAIARLKEIQRFLHEHYYAASKTGNMRETLTGLIINKST